MAARFFEALDLVETYVSRVAQSVGPSVCEEDLRSAGREGLLDAAHRFDVEFGVPFRAFAIHRVRGAVLDGAEKNALLPREEDDARGVLESLARLSPSPECELERAELLALIQSSLHTLSSQESELIRRHYFNGERFDEVARELSLSKSWASRLHTRALERLTKRLRRRT